MFARLRWVLLASLTACAAPAPRAESPVRAAAAPVASSCERESVQAEADRSAGFWLRAAHEFESLIARCPGQRPRADAALVELVVELEDATNAERLLNTTSSGALMPAQRARLAQWLDTWRRASPANSSRILVEAGSVLASQGAPAAQPYFDRARVALERETAQRPQAFVLAATLSQFEDAVWSPDGAELWLWGGGLDDLAPRGYAVPAPTAVVFDVSNWEAVWRASAESRACSSVVLPGGAGFARCDGIFARDGRRLRSVPELNSATVVPFVTSANEPLLLAARKQDEHASRVGLLDTNTGAFTPLPLPPIERLVALGASPQRDWFFVESVRAVEVFAYPSLVSLLRAPASNVQALTENQLAFVSRGDLEVWQLRPPKRLARHYLPEVVIPHGSSLGSTYFRSVDPQKLWVQFLATESTWSWHANPSITPSGHDTADELPDRSLSQVSVDDKARWEARLERDDRLEFDGLRVLSPQGSALEAESSPLIKGFAVAPNGKRLAFNLGNKTLAVVDVDSMSAPRTLDFKYIRRLAFYDNERLVLELPTETWLVDARDGTHQSLEQRPGEHFFARGSDGVTVATGSGDGVSVYAANGALQTAFELTPVLLSPSGAWLLLKGSDRLALASTKEGTRALLLDAHADVERAQFSADESRLATLGASGLVVWDGVAGTKWRVSPRAPLGEVTSLDLASENQIVVVGYANGEASAFDYVSGKRVPRPFARAGEGEINWANTARFVRAYGRHDGRWLGALGFAAHGDSAFVLSRDGQLDFLGPEPKPGPRCAFGNQLVAWSVCSDELRVPGLLKHLLRAASGE